MLTYTHNKNLAKEIKDMEEDKTKSKNKIYIGIVVALIIVLAICGSIYYYKDYFSASSFGRFKISTFLNDPPAFLIASIADFDAN